MTLHRFTCTVIVIGLPSFEGFAHRKLVVTEIRRRLRLESSFGNEVTVRSIRINLDAPQPFEQAISRTRALVEVMAPKSKSFILVFPFAIQSAALTREGWRDGMRLLNDLLVRPPMARLPIVCLASEAPPHFPPRGTFFPGNCGGDFVILVGNCIASTIKATELMCDLISCQQLRTITLC